MKRILFSFSCTLALILAGCSSSPAPETAKKAPEKKEAVPASGKSAIFETYKVARQWAQDAQLLLVESVNTEEVKADAGKYGAWRCTYVSLGTKRTRVFGYAVAPAGGMSKGVNPGQEQAYIAKALIRPFAIQVVKTDSTDALEVASKEMKDFAEKQKDTPKHFQLEWTGQTMAPAWRVYWGPTIAANIGSAYVDAREPKFIKKVR
jgi:hypothetical protein